jgi:HAD superfamily hydrolase (TIGR01509 family)
MSRALRAVVFDWDGTLVDSAAVSYRCYSRLFESFGLPFDREAFARTYSPDWTRTYEALGLPRARWDEADRLWLDLYGREHSALFPAARETLDALATEGFAIGLVTSGDRMRVTAELRDLGLDSLFRSVVCGGDVKPKKPHPAALLRALDSLGTPPAHAVYVGDSPEDVLMARAAGVLSVGIPGGFPNREALLAARPDWVVFDLEALRATIGPGPAAR